MDLEKEEFEIKNKATKIASYNLELYIYPIHMEHHSVIYMNFIL